MRDSAGGVLGVEHRVGHELADVVVLQAIEHLGSLAPGAHQARHPEFGQVLGHRGGGLAHSLGQVVDAQFAADQRPQQLDAGGVGEHAEHLEDQVGVVVGETGCMLICIHTQIIAVVEGTMSGDWGLPVG